MTSPLRKKENFSLRLAPPGGGPEVPLDMIFVHGGTFRMGTAEGDPDAYSDEHPAHDVTLPHFFIGRYPLTQAQWLAALGGENPAFFQADDRPVEQVSWDDITQTFLPALNKMTGLDFRLPTEAEWEYAAKGGTHHAQDFRYAGSDHLKEVGWYDNNSHGETKPVGLKLPNALGLYDMSGNVWEWCEDDWHDNYEGAPTDGAAWINRPERGGSRVQRGGSYWDGPRLCRVASRGINRPARRRRLIGFRLAASFQSVD